MKSKITFATLQSSGISDVSQQWLHNASNSIIAFSSSCTNWAKAFDRIKPDALIHALKRFGIPQPMVDMIEGIYNGRCFVIRDPCGDSSVRLQRAGIAQGCPLSPYLFILVQTVLLADVDHRLALCGPFTKEPEFVVCPDVLYADDTILIGSDVRRVQLHLRIVIDEGRRYGLELNASKTVMLQVNHTGSIYHESEEVVKVVDEALCLGGLLASNAEVRPEITRRIGETRSIFKKLQQCWNHAIVTRHRKLELFRGIVVPKLMYNLESIWINQDGLNRINSFHVRGLRQICRIAPSFISRVPNSEIYALCGESLLSMVLHKRQTKLYQSITELPENDVMRKLT